MKFSKLLFKKKDLIFKINQIKWVKSHAWVPTAYKLKNTNNVIVFFAGRNKSNESDIGYFIYDLIKLKIVGVSNKPILSRGCLGSFDDSAVIPSHVLKIGRRYHLYYVGWTQGKKVPFFSNVGLATSSNIFGPYRKLSNSPILGKSKFDPYFVATCFVNKIKKGYEMYYTSNLFWRRKKNISYPRYLIKKCFSKNGIDWQVNNKKVINFKNKKEVAITRPWIISIKKRLVMFFSIKKKKYEIQTNILINKSTWKRKKIFDFHKNKKVKFDSVSQEYASIIKYNKKIYMFYNGNNYGNEGVGLAIANIND